MSEKTTNGLPKPDHVYDLEEITVMLDVIAARVMKMQDAIATLDLVLTAVIKVVDQIAPAPASPQAPVTDYSGPTGPHGYL